MEKIFVHQEPDYGLVPKIYKELPKVQQNKNSEHQSMGRTAE